VQAVWRVRGVRAAIAFDGQQALLIGLFGATTHTLPTLADQPVSAIGGLAAVLTDIGAEEHAPVILGDRLDVILVNGLGVELFTAHRAKKGGEGEEEETDTRHMLHGAILDGAAG